LGGGWRVASTRLDGLVKLVDGVGVSDGGDVDCLAVTAVLIDEQVRKTPGATVGPDIWTVSSSFSWSTTRW
jgi:hypothetical protein